MKVFASIEVIASILVFAALIKSSFTTFLAKVQYAQRFRINLFTGKSHLAGLSFDLSVDCLIADAFCEVKVFIRG